MRNYTVAFHDNLNESELQALTRAISLFKGVVSVTCASGNANSELLDMNFAAPNLQTPPSHAPPSLGAAQAITPQNTSNQAESQKQIISNVIKWGVHQKKVSLEQLHTSSAEGTIEMAKKLIEIMPNEVREKILKS